MSGTKHIQPPPELGDDVAAAIDARIKVGVKLAVATSADEIRDRLRALHHRHVVISEVGYFLRNRHPEQSLWPVLASLDFPEEWWEKRWRAENKPGPDKVEWATKIWAMEILREYQEQQEARV